MPTTPERRCPECVAAVAHCHGTLIQAAAPECTDTTCADLDIALHPLVINLADLTPVRSRSVA